MSKEISDFFFDIPLYCPCKIENLDLACKIFKQGSCHFDGYNPWKKYESSFYVCDGLTWQSDSICHQLQNESFHFQLILKCKRSGDVFYYKVYWNAEDNTLMKYGQYPSVADFHISEVKKYNKLLSKEKIKEFTRAIGLAANGVGIGAFVYLRRIFEYLVKEAYEMCLKDKTVKEDEFQQARMDEKIKLLSTHLPKFLVDNSKMYSILSLGIHELNEKDCLQHFDALRIGIEIILDEKLDELRKKEKIESAKKKLGMVHQEVKETK